MSLEQLGSGKMYSRAHTSATVLWLRQIKFNIQNSKKFKVTIPVVTLNENNFLKQAMNSFRCGTETIMTGCFWLSLEFKPCPRATLLSQCFNP